MDSWLRRLGRGARLTAVTLLAAAVAAGVIALLGRPAGRGNPLAGDSFAVDPQSVVVAAERGASPVQAAALRTIAGEPLARWFGDWIPAPEVTAQVKQFEADADRADQVPVLVLYDIPYRDCAGAARGGQTSAAGYRTFVRWFAAALGNEQSVVIVEPDALAELSCLTPSEQQERLALIRFVVDTLHRNKHVVTYIDAGNSGFTKASTIAQRLRAADIAHAQGFALNVSNFYPTSAEAAYGRKISQKTGGAHFVIDTSRNGRGAATGAQAWCNPPGRALGHPPTTETGDSLADAWLWIKTPGESDGPCQPGAPQTGQFWLPYALGLVARSTG